MPENIQIRLSEPSDRDAILRFIEQMGFNPRDAVTWDALNMVAMTAWDGNRLIGAIPIELRDLRTSVDSIVKTAHETVVAVDEHYRGSGIGSAMQKEISHRRPGEPNLLTVFREQPESPTYRWYLKNGFHRLIEIESWMCPDPAGIAISQAKCWSAEDAAAPWDQFEKTRRQACGMVHGRRLRDWLAVHPYRRRYSFWIVQDVKSAFALLGVGTMHSDTLRAEIMAVSKTSDYEAILRSVAGAAIQKHWHTIRLPLAKTDPLADVARHLGFKNGWAFDLLGKALDHKKIDATRWQYASIDYI